MKMGVASAFNIVTRLSISTKFAIMMGGFMTVLLLTTAASFWTAAKQGGDATVINIAGRQRMLSQKMTKEALALTLGKAKEEEVLATVGLFEKSLSDLIMGNKESGIQAAQDLIIREQLGKVQRIWKDFRFNITALIKINDERRDVYNTLLTTNTQLLSDMNDAVFMMEQEGLDARTINLAGRQRMLSQKMTKEALAFEWGAAKKEELIQTVNQFDRTLTALINGDPGLGLQPMKKAAILSQLRKVEERWGLFKSNAEKLAAVSEPAMLYSDYLLTNSIPLLKEMDTAVSQYEQFSNAKIKNLQIVQLFLLLTSAVFFIIGWIFITRPIVTSFTEVTQNLAEKSRDITGVTAELAEGARAQTGIVTAATKNLEDMVIHIIQEDITLSVEKQSEISKAFGEFLKHFVERTSAEIAMGMMSVSQQSKDARETMDSFVAELGAAEKNIRLQEETIGGMVLSLKAIASTNEEVKKMARSSKDAADGATSKANLGLERMELISSHLDKIKNSSEGVKDITESLATITENIKILALNMSLKVEDIKDDTGKSYGFEAMSARVQHLAEEMEGLLVGSRDMIIPTIEGVAEVSTEANQAKEMIAEVTRSITIADNESRSIAEKIEAQAAEIDSIEVEAENLRAIAHKSTQTIEAQGALVADVQEMLTDSEELIKVVNSQTTDAVEGARKVTQMMGQMGQAVMNIEAGTGKLTEKSGEILDMFEKISRLATKNNEEADKLNIVNKSVRSVSFMLSEVVKGSSKGLKKGKHS